MSDIYEPAKIETEEDMFVEIAGIRIPLIQSDEPRYRYVPRVTLAQIPQRALK